MGVRPGYFHRLIDATSQWLNVALWNGDANESLSGRSHREGPPDMTRRIDAVFAALGDPGHSRSAHEADVGRCRKFVEENS